MVVIATLYICTYEVSNISFDAWILHFLSSLYIKKLNSFHQSFAILKLQLPVLCIKAIIFLFVTCSSQVLEQVTLIGCPNKFSNSCVHQTQYAEVFKSHADTVHCSKGYFLKLRSRYKCVHILYINISLYIYTV